MKRVHRAQLPGHDAERLVETLGKIAAIAKSRQEAVRALEEISEQLRRSEFARERAESMAKARGVALMKCQEALGDAEEQQVQLSGLLRNALEQLGVGNTTSHANTPYTNGSKYSYYSNHIGRHANITPPSGMPSVPAPPHQTHHLHHTRSTPMTGFTVYSNPVSEETDRDDFVTPARNGTYYSDEENEGTVGSQDASLNTGSQRTIGAETAQKLAREVLPHLGSSEIAYLVEYNQNLKEKELLRQQFDSSHNDVKTKTSTFVVGNGDANEFLIGTGQYPGGIPSVERRRNAAARIVAKLNERLPQELHISSLAGIE